MESDKRADIVAMMSNIKVVIELKRDNHAEVWTAIESQLDRFYTRDYDAKGFGIYGVFWFGSKRARAVPNPPGQAQRPLTSEEMQAQLLNLLPPEKKRRIAVFVLDIAGPTS